MIGKRKLNHSLHLGEGSQHNYWKELADQLAKGAASVVKQKLPTTKSRKAQ